MKIKLRLIDTVGIAIGLLFFFFILSKSYQTYSDSASYISNSILRTPLYPLLLDLFQYIFGDGRYLHIIPIFQAIFGLVSCFFLANILEKEFKVGTWVKYFIFLILLYPQFKFASYISTESVTYSLFLLVLSFWIKHIFAKNNRDIYLAIFFMFLSILTRPQLYFLLPVLFLYSIFSGRLKNGLIIIFILIGGIFVNDAFQKTYNYIYHGRYALYSSGGILFATAQIYLSDIEDINLFSDQKEREFFKRVYQAMNERKMLHEYGWEMHGGLESSHYLTFYNPMLELVTTTFNEFYSNERGKSEADKLTEQNKFFQKISKRLFINNYKKFLKFSARSIYEVIGFFIIPIISLLVAGVYGFLKKKNSLFIFFVITALLSLSNYCMLLFIQPLWIMRYRFYTDIMIVVAFVLLSFMVSCINHRNIADQETV